LRNKRRALDRTIIRRLVFGLAQQTLGMAFGTPHLLAIDAVAIGYRRPRDYSIHDEPAEVSGSATSVLFRLAAMVAKDSERHYGSVRRARLLPGC